MLAILFPLNWSFFKFGDKYQCELVNWRGHKAASCWGVRERRGEPSCAEQEPCGPVAGPAPDGQLEEGSVPPPGDPATSGHE